MMDWPRMKLNRNHKCEQPSRLVFLDTETMAYPDKEYPGHERHILRLGVASIWTKGKSGYSRRGEKTFITSSEFWEWFYTVLRDKKPTWVYGHNLAFDFTVLGGWREIDLENLRIYERTQVPVPGGKDGETKYNVWRGKLALDGIPFIVEARHNNGPCKWVDTYNYWNVPLSKLGKYVGIPKLEYIPWEIDLDNVYEYCRNDVAIIEKAVITLMDYWKSNDLGNWQPTIASLAFSAYRHGKESCTIVAHGDNHDEEEESRFAGIVGECKPMSARDITEVEKRTYFGGRTECFYVGDITSRAVPFAQSGTNLFQARRPTIPGPITVLDVNSMYPFCMASFKHPYELLDAIRFPKLSDALRLCQEFWCAADVELDTNEGIYPRRIGSFVHYPKGCFTTALSGAELNSAAKQGVIRGICNLAIYHSGRPFASFIKDWHQRRVFAIEYNREVESRFCNLIMQSLYGKFAQLTPIWQTDGNSCPPIRWGTYFGQQGDNPCPQIMRAIGGVSQYQSPRRACRHTFVAVAASVTASAREYMRSLIDLCPPSSIVYMDTDSLFCLPSAVQKLQELCLIHPTELGKFKEKGTYENVRIWGPKDYELDEVRVIAGLRSDAIEISDRLWNQLNFEGVKSIIQHEPNYEVLMKTVRFAPSTTIHSRAIGWNGWTIPMEAN